MAAPGFLDYVTPWSSRTGTPRPSEKDAPDKRAAAGQGQQQGGDHRVNPRHRLSIREYPDDAPPLKVRWFFSESPKRKPKVLCKLGDPPRPLVPAKKFIAFSAQDSRSIESSFQKLAEEEEKQTLASHASSDLADDGQHRKGLSKREGSRHRGSGSAQASEESFQALVPVNEDFLFDVDIDARELAPAYWLGPIYEVRRGTWFYQDGSSSRPCDENLATQLEEGYVKTRPWRLPQSESSRTASTSRSRPNSWKPIDGREKAEDESTERPRGLSVDDAASRRLQDGTVEPIDQTKFQLQTHRLFGAHMNSIVTYQDATTAWLLTDDFMSRMSSSVYQRFAGGGHLGGVKVVRGFVEPTTGKEQKADPVSSTKPLEKEGRGRSPGTGKDDPSAAETDPPLDAGMIRESISDAESNTRRQELERRMENIVKSPGLPDPVAEEEEVRKREQAEIKEDYQKPSGEEQGREIDHLVFVTHGIGQRLGLKMESLNFIHDVNVLRKTLKSVYNESKDLQALNSEVDQLPKNCRIQVLPIVWRYLLDFPRPASGTQRREQDLSEMNTNADDLGYPSLHDITVDGVPAIRNLVEDLFLDILLYQSAYREHIADIMQRECNQVYKRFKARNPQFKGKVSLMGHSLGSAIFFDLLCWQKDKDSSMSSNQSKSASRRASYQKHREDGKDFALDFDVDHFYCLGSPIGLFQMIKGRTVCGRSPAEPGNVKESWNLQASGLVSSPKCRQIFNIFHPTDPVAYRIEPLVSPAMKHLKPQPLPYVKKGIFGAPGSGLTGIGTRVGQSVSGLWSNITTGVASTLLNRSLGLNSDPQLVSGQPKRQSTMAGAMEAVGEGGRADQKGSATADEGMTAAVSAHEPQKPDKHPDDDPSVETLYSGFRRHQSGSGPAALEAEPMSPEWQHAEARTRQLRIEEAKIRGLNQNGRIDYSIQE